MKDRFGVDITPGTVVTYPYRKGSTLAMVDGVVAEVRGASLSIIPIQETATFTKETFRRTQIRVVVTKTNTVTVVPQAKLTPTFNGQQKIDTYSLV